MTLTLTPDTEARLRSVAAQRGLPPEKTIDILLAEADTDFQEAIAGIQRVFRKRLQAFSGAWMILPPDAGSP